MIRSIAFLVLSAAFCCSSVAAQDSGFGLGIILGEPTGLSLKQWIGNSTALDGAVAWSFGHKDAFHLHADYLVHNFWLIRVEEDKSPLYYGIGGRIKFEDDSKIGVRFPLGMDYLFQNTPVDIFLEIVPILNLVPDTDFDLNGAIGVRYFFPGHHWD